MSILFYFILLGLLLFVLSDRTRAASQQNQRSYGGFSKKQLFESGTEERRKRERERDRQAHGLWFRVGRNGLTLEPFCTIILPGIVQQSGTREESYNSAVNRSVECRATVV